MKQVAFMCYEIYFYTHTYSHTNYKNVAMDLKANKWTGTREDLKGGKEKRNVVTIISNN